MKKERVATAYASLLREHGLAATKQRLAPLRALLKTRMPVSVEELTKKSGEDMNLTTGYRAVETLVKVGLAKQVHFGSGPALFESSRFHHHHVVCKKCQKINDVTVCVPEKTYTQALQHAPLFDRIEDHAIEFFGICTTCAKKS